MLIGSECKWHIKAGEHNVIDLVEAKKLAQEEKGEESGS